MSIRRFIAPVLVGLGLVAIGLAGCEQRINTTGTPPVPPVPVVPADRASLDIVWPSGTSVSTATITLSFAGTVVETETVTSPTGTTTHTFTDLGVGTYQVTVSARNFTVQSALLTIVDAIEPSATISMVAIATSPTVVVEEKTVSAGDGVTVIPVEQPDAVKDLVGATTAPASVSVQNFDGVMSVATVSQADVPVIVTGSTVSSVVVSAVQIQIDAEDPDAAVDISLPLPIEASEFAAAAGGTVDIIRFDVATASWLSIGTATIGANGTATTSLTGLAANTIVAIGQAPKVTQADKVVAPIKTVTPSEIDALRSSGQTTVTYDVSPQVAYQATKVSQDDAAARLAAAPPGIPAPVWAVAAPIIAAREPGLAAWVNGRGTGGTVDVSGVGTITVNVDRRTGTFTFTMVYGGVAKTFTLTITFTKGVVTVIHDTGDAVAG